MKTLLYQLLHKGHRSSGSVNTSGVWPSLQNKSALLLPWMQSAQDFQTLPSFAQPCLRSYEIAGKVSEVFSGAVVHPGGIIATPDNCLKPLKGTKFEVIMPNNFKDDKIQKVKSGTLRLKTRIVHHGLFLESMVGAGILLNKKGYVLTNAHVVSQYFDFEVPGEGALAPRWLPGKVLANFYGGVQCDAEVLSVDIGNDLALLKIPESVIKPYNIPCEFSKGVRDGADFFVVGHPNGPPFNVKFGFVSNRSRPPSDIPRDILNDGFPHSLEHMDPAMKFLELQVEAAPGFSGGPLSTVDGLMFGVLHAGIEGTGYGIPVAIIKSAVRRMLNRSRSPGYDVFCHLN